MKASAATEDTISLWNPDTAALLSWALFGISFGAAVHAANWKRLGQTRRMWDSIAWSTLPIGSVVVLVLLSTIYKVPLPPKTVWILPLFGMNGMVVAWWYFTVGREQSKHIVATVKNSYVRESWFGPIAIAITPFIVFWAASS